MEIQQTNDRQKQLSLLALAGFSFSLILFRIMMTQSVFYGFLIFNLILAVIPFLISSALLANPKLQNRKFLFFTITFIWLLFFPNAPYIVTDFLHFKWESSMPGWFDVLMLTSFSWSGVAFGFVSLADMDKIWSSQFSQKTATIIIFITSMLAGFGIYIGRFLRYNSWDILSQPVDLVIDISSLLLQPKAMGFSFGYGIFIFLLYRFFKHAKNN